MTPEAKKFYAGLEKNRARVIAVKNVNDMHPKRAQPCLGIVPGGYGLVSEAEFLNNQAHLVKVSVPEWDSKGFQDGDPIKRKSRKKAEPGEEAQDAA